MKLHCTTCANEQIIPSAAMCRECEKFNEEDSDLTEIFETAKISDDDMFSSLSKWQKFIADIKGRSWAYWWNLKCWLKNEDE